MPIQLHKTDMLRKGQEGHVRIECDVFNVTARSDLQYIGFMEHSFRRLNHLLLNPYY
jgi:hypothetical protein